jgi:hypothetical protein
MENKDIAQILWAVNGPIITAPGGWGNNPPKTIVDRIRIERMTAILKKEEKATLTEALWYLSTLSFLGPLDHDSYKIMSYLTRDFCISTGKEMLDFLEEEIILNNTQDYDLQKLRNRIYASSMKPILESLKAQNRERKEKEKLNKEEEKIYPIQHSLLDFIGKESVCELG